MLAISEAAVTALSCNSMDTFVASCRDMLAEYFPDVCALSDEQVITDHIHAAAEAAASNGFDQVPEALQFAYLHFLLGSAFASRPQFAWLSRIFSNRVDPAEARMEAAMDQVAARMEAGQPLEDPLTRDELDTMAATARANA